jgi:hypothetical protein
MRESKEDLIKMIKDIFWNDGMITLAIRLCFESMRQRVVKVIARDG